MVSNGDTITVKKAIKLMRNEGYKFDRIQKDKMIFTNSNQKVTIVYDSRLGDTFTVKEVMII